VIKRLVDPATGTPQPFAKATAAKAKILKEISVPGV
jgi:hypothetical protein